MLSSPTFLVRRDPFHSETFQKGSFSHMDITPTVGGTSLEIINALYIMYILKRIHRIET